MRKYLLLLFLTMSGVVYSQMTFYVAPSRGGAGASGGDHGGSWDLDENGDLQSSGIWMYDSNGDSQLVARPTGTEGYWEVNVDGDVTVMAP
jgi:hypothetical protein